MCGIKCDILGWFGIALVIYGFVVFIIILLSYMTIENFNVEALIETHLEIWDLRKWEIISYLTYFEFSQTRYHKFLQLCKLTLYGPCMFKIGPATQFLVYITLSTRFSSIFYCSIYSVRNSRWRPNRHYKQNDFLVNCRLSGWQHLCFIMEYII